MASGDAVEQIKNKLSIEEVVAPYVELHKAGKHLKGRSPFTSEKTPSFYVSPDRGMYYCFSSNQGGDMFTFISAMEGVDFKGALKILAEKAGVELVPEDPKKRTAREQKYAALETATKFYEAALGGPGGAAARQYLEKRGVTDKTRQLWRIGLAPDEWRAVKDELESRNYSADTIRGVGLIKGEAGKEPYDVFRNRILFPIFDPSSRVIAYSGRTLSQDPDTPKYVNSPETELFNKSETLYGYDKAKNGIRKFDFSLIVEGQFDVVLTHQAGYNNSVAVSGTALTGAHVNLLARLSNRVVLALDADRAGLSAVKRAAELMLSRGMDVKVARLPEGKDPADIIAADAGSFKKIIGASVPVVEHLIDVYKTTSRDDRAFKIAVREEVLPLVLRIPSLIDREHFEGIIAERLETTKDGVHQELRRLEAQQAKKPTENATATTTERAAEHTPSTNRKTDLVAYLVALCEVLPESDIKRVSACFDEIAPVSFADERRGIDALQTSRLSFVIEADESLSTSQSQLQAAHETLQSLRRIYEKEHLRTLREALVEAEREHDESRVQELLAKIKIAQHTLAAEPQLLL